MQKNIYTLFFIILFLTSCSITYKVQVNSNLPKTADEQMYFENDSLRIHFKFANQDRSSLFQFEFFNKLNEPVYWDKEKTIVQFERNDYTYANTQSLIKLDLDTNFLSPTIKGVMQNKATSSFILPNGYLRTEPRVFFDNQYTNEEFLVKKEIDWNNKKKQIFFQEYAPEVSPGKLRLFVTLVYGKDAKSTTQYFDFNFWVTEVQRLGSLILFSENEPIKQNVYFTKKSSFLVQ